MPEEWRERMTDLPDSAKREINNINTELVKKLQSKDTAFSQGRSMNSTHGRSSKSSQDRLLNILK